MVGKRVSMVEGEGQSEFEDLPLRHIPTNRNPILLVALSLSFHKPLFSRK